MLRLLRFSVAHPRLILALSLAFTLVCCFGVPRIRPRLDARSLIPAGDPSMAAGDAAAKLFRQRDVVVLAIAAPGAGVYTPEALRLLTVLGNDLARVDGIVPGSIVSLATVPRLSIDNDVLDLRPLLERGAPPDAAMALRIRRETAALGLDDGVLVARDGKAAAIYAEVEPAADRSRLSERVRAVVARHQGSGFPIYLSGTAMAQAVLGDAAARDLVRLVPLVIAVVAGVMIFAFRHPAPAFVSLVEVGFSQIWTIGMMGFKEQPVFVTTLVLPVILIVIGVTDDIYALNSYFSLARRHPDRPVRELVIETFSEVSRPILLTSIATITGLLSLALTNLEPQRVFGIYGALSVLFSSLLTFTVVPALLVLLDLKLAPLKVPFARFAERTIATLVGGLTRIGPRVALLLIAGALAVAGFLVATRLKIEDNWIGNLPPHSLTATGDRAINRLLAGTNTLDLMFDSGRPDGFLDPRVFSALGKVEDALAASSWVGSVEGTYRDIVSVNAALSGLDYQSLRDALRRGERTLSRTEIEQAALLLSSAPHIPGGHRLDGSYQRSRMTVFVHEANYSRIGHLLDLATRLTRRHFGAGVALTPFGDGWISFLTVRMLVVGQARSIGFALISDTFLLILLFRSFKTALLAELPVLSCVLLVFGTLAATGIPLGTANSMFASIVLGIGVDYSIHLVAAFREKLKKSGDPREAILAAVTGTGPAILLSAFAIVAGFSVMAFSAVPPNRQLGLLICLSLAICACITLALIPTLVLARRAQPAGDGRRR
jgi:predicted RND superfamily exporter protein